ncbi:hypothetical protein [Actinoplanes couchii]|uniref:Uncharacterized protein n=1 Tax=Actinoplanes couchii TaxID=403638 RepID=A0ABQ3XAY2_9ACTN|nr:hypothetical protein [Actinoplanes couchii]MDR6324804.1 hypothetical protein [Actinoplanes couchii]GID55575.1 hypothetical protein Aco03nite_039790 [Actinoplanes couchii]
MPDPFSSGRESALDSPRPIVPTPAMMAGDLRGRRVLVGLPGYGWRGDLRADEKVVQGSRTYIPVMPEGEWYRAEAERTEVFAALVPVERVWVEELGFAGTSTPGAKVNQLVSLDEPPRRPPVSAIDADSLTGRRVTQVLDDGEERRDLRAVTESHVSDDGTVTVRVAQELDWYRWGWSGKLPRTLEVPAHLIWVE